MLKPITLAITRALRSTRPEEPMGMTNDVPAIVVPWARWNRTVDAIASELEPFKVDAIEFLHHCGLDRQVPFDDLEVTRW
jgi:hypothetical protein